MTDLSIITAGFARDRVADQFTGRAVAAAAPRRPLRRTAVRALRALADRLDPTPAQGAARGSETRTPDPGGCPARLSSSPHRRPAGSMGP